MTLVTIGNVPWARFYVTHCVPFHGFYRTGINDSTTCLPALCAEHTVLAVILIVRNREFKATIVGKPAQFRNLAVPESQHNNTQSGDTEERIRLMVVDDQPVILRGLSMILDAEPDIDVVAQAKDGIEAERIALEILPDVIVMDLNMPGQGGVVTTRNITAAHPQINIIVLTTFDDDDTVFEAVRAGALSYLLKDVSEDEIVDSVRAVRDGNTYLSPRIARKIMDQFRTYDLVNPALKSDSAPKSDTQAAPRNRRRTDKDVNQLTDKEQQILEFIAQGLSNKRIGKNMFLAEGTVKNYVSRIMDKLHTRSRTELAIHALKGKSDSTDDAS